MKVWISRDVNENSPVKVSIDEPEERNGYYSDIYIMTIVADVYHSLTGEALIPRASCQQVNVVLSVEVVKR